MTLLVRQLLETIDAFLAASDTAEKTLSFRMFGDSKTIGLLRSGSDITTARLENALNWLSENWPSDAAWPRDVKRPGVRRSRAAA